MRFGSVCSGIEAASVAWHPLGWQAAWFSEIEPFPSAVLAHHYPNTPNLGDMTKIARRVLSGEVEAPDLLCGGTPCQAFSVAGLRQSLDDARGSLTLKFVELANAIDHVRGLRGGQPAVVFWENVPGVLSTKDNAFGCFLAGLAGEDDELQPPRGRWENAGCVYGPRRAVAWRTLDAQYFGLAQRRRRVFVVASARNDFDPAQVLFEWQGLRRDLAPSREAREGTAAGTLRSSDGGSDTDHARAQHLIAGTLQANGKAAGSATQQDAEAGLLVTAFGGNNTSGPIQAAPALNCNGGQRSGDFEAGALLTVAQPLPFDTTQITSATNRCRPEAGDPCHPLAAGAHAPAIAFQGRGSNLDLGQDVTGTLTSNGDRASGGAPCIAYPGNLSGTQAATTENLAPAMGAKNPTAVAFTDTRGDDRGSGIQVTGDIANTMHCAKGPSEQQAVATAMQVRRLTPRECERLQGFPDDYTLIPWRKRPAEECPDGPRYKALGNSWAVDCVAWIGRRLDAALRRAAA